MKNFSTILLISLFIISLSGLAFGQIFTEDFESGTPDESWEQYRVDEEMITAIEMQFAPVALETGGSYVGYIHDADISYNGAAILLSGETTAQNYSIEGDVYCYVNDPGGSAYTGLVVYGDSSVGTYIKMAADFDSDQRIRFYNNRLDPVTFQYTFHHAFSADDIPGGVPTEAGWHRMKVEAQTLDNGTTAFWCYFDGNLLAGCPIIDDSQDRMASGQYGLYAFQMDGDGIPGFFDNIIVEELPVGINEDLADVPRSITLSQNFPNPFNPETSISYELTTSEFINLTVFDILGKEVNTLVAESKTPGSYTVVWNGTDNNGKIVPSGIYFYTLKSNSFTQTKKMVFMK